jgi:hypothetical protein
MAPVVHRFLHAFTWLADQADDEGRETPAALRSALPSPHDHKHEP